MPTSNDSQGLAARILRSDTARPAGTWPSTTEGDAVALVTGLRHDGRTLRHVGVHREGGEYVVQCGNALQAVVGTRSPILARALLAFDFTMTDATYRIEHGSLEDLQARIQGRVDDLLRANEEGSDEPVTISRWDVAGCSLVVALAPGGYALSIEGDMGTSFIGVTSDLEGLLRCVASVTEASDAKAASAAAARLATEVDRLEPLKVEVGPRP